MKPKVVENYSDLGVDVGRIVRRILSHIPADTLAGLSEVRLLDSHESAFASYSKNQKTIRIYVSELLGDFPPLLLKMFYPLTYMIIGMAVGHELDHHVTRNCRDIDREESAEENIMRYVYPSLGPFKPILISFKFLYKPIHRYLVLRGNKTNLG